RFGPKLPQMAEAVLIRQGGGPPPPPSRHRRVSVFWFVVGVAAGAGAVWGALFL
ncbi:MAG: ubiquinone biosynthesis protein, partial [Paracoccaceae bacterium]